MSISWAATTVPAPSASSAMAQSTRVKCRIAGADVNPISGFGTAGAGLDGIERELEPPRSCAATPTRAGGAALPSSCTQPSPSGRAAASAREAFGEEVWRHYPQLRPHRAGRLRGGRDRLRAPADVRACLATGAGWPWRPLCRAAPRREPSRAGEPSHAGEPSGARVPSRAGEPSRAGVLELAAAVRGGARSARAECERRLALASEREELGAFWVLAEEHAVAQAEAVDRVLADGRDPGALAGVPVAWKDSIDVAGLPMSAGVPPGLGPRALGGAGPVGARPGSAHGAAAAARWFAPGWRQPTPPWSRAPGAGSVELGKLAMHQLAWGMSGQCPGRRPARIPTIPSAYRAARPRARPWPWPRASWTSPAGPTRGARCAPRPPSAGSWG